jgi:hypothetical protein
MEQQQGTVAMPQTPRRATGRLTGTQYAKLADWGERVALAMFGSLVVQRIVQGISIASISIIVGALVAALVYGLAYYWLKQAK